jgi:hypothetical protein
MSADADNTFDELADTITAAFDSNLQRISSMPPSDIVTVNESGVVLGPAILGYPTYLLLLEFEHHVVMEAFGYSAKYVPLEVRRKRATRSLDSYLWQFAEEQLPEVALFQFSNNENVGLNGLVIGATTQLEAARKQFWIPDDRAALVASDFEGLPIRILPGVRSLYFDDVVIVNQHGGLFRIKYIQFLAVLTKSETPHQIRSRLNRELL